MKKIICLLFTMLLAVSGTTTAFASCEWNIDELKAEWTAVDEKTYFSMYKGSTEIDNNRICKVACAKGQSDYSYLNRILENGPGSYYFVLRDAEGNVIGISEVLQISTEAYENLAEEYVTPAWAYSKGYWYLSDPFGNMLYGWHLVNEKWYYMDEDTGKCYIKTYTPDGYYVDETGAWDGNESINN